MKDDQKAFPVTYGNDGVEHGMTLRDYFAAKAMQGVCANSKNKDVYSPDLANWSYEVADAMMEARKK